MKREGSQGQTKTYVISLKLAQFDFLRQIAGFGLEDSKITILHTPLWVWGGCVGTWFFAIAVTYYLTKFVFVDFSLEDDDEEEAK